MSLQNVLFFLILLINQQHIYIQYILYINTCSVIPLCLEVASHVPIYNHDTLTPACHKLDQKFLTTLLELKHVKSSFLL